MGSKRRPETKGQDGPRRTRKPWPKVAIIILNWNGWRDTIECLESLQQITYPNYQIIVVDNGSTDDSVEKIKAWARGEIPVESKFLKYDPSTKPVQWIEYDRATAEASGSTEEETKLRGLPPYHRLVIIQTGDNLGFSGGNNIGIKYALAQGADYVLLLNDDTVVAPGFVEPLIEVCIQDRNVGMAGPKINYYDHPDTIHSAGGKVSLWRGQAWHVGLLEKDVGQYEAIRAVEYLTGCVLLVSREVCETIGLLDENYFLYFEDTDWCLRARSAGFELVYVPSSQVWHKTSITLWTSRNTTQAFYLTRNQLYFMRKHARWYHWLVFSVLWPNQVSRR